MMRIKIVNITDRGIPGQERLHLSVVAPTNLTNYIVFATQRMPLNKVKTPPDDAYWFANQQVYPGDQVILYTAPGQNSIGQRSDGRWNRFLYWGLDHTIWDDLSSCAVLLEVNEWESKF